MANPSPHKHLGFNIEFDDLIQRGNIHMNSADWKVLHAVSGDVVKFMHENQPNTSVADSTTFNATQIGPISGPDAGTGPLVPVGSLEKPAVLVPNPDDRTPNARTIHMDADNTQHEIAAEPMEQPTPTDPVTPEPTEVADEHSQHIDTHETADLPENKVDTVPLPEHPAIENQPPEHHEG